MASDKFEVGDILVCVDDSPWADIPSQPRLVREKAYEVSEVRRQGDVRLVGRDTTSWKGERFRRATLGEIRKYRKEQGYEKHQFAIGELVVGIAQDYLLPVIGQTHVVSATKSDDEHECFIDIDGGKVPGQHFAAKFRKATPAEAAAYRKANGGPPFKAAPAAKNGAPADSIDSVEIGDEIVFVGPSNKNGREYGTLAIVQGVIYKSGSKIHELRIHVPGDGWTYTTPDSWVPVGRGYELVALGQPIHTGDEWLEAGRWNRTSFRTEQGWTKGTSGILRRKVKEDAVTVQIGNNPPFKAALLDPPTFNLTFTWEGPEKKPLTAHDAPEEINKAINLPNPQCLTSADGREFDIIDWNPKVKTGEVVTVEANLMPKLAKGPKPEPKPKATPFIKGDIVVCTDSTDQHVAVADRIALGRTYRIEGIDSMGFFRIQGMRGHWGTSRFRLATVAEITAYWEKLGFPNHQFKVDDIVVCVDARPYSPYSSGVVVSSQLEEGKAYKVESVLVCDIKPSGCVAWNRVRFRLATPAEAQAFLDAEQASKRWGPKAGDIVVCVRPSFHNPNGVALDKTYRIKSIDSFGFLSIEGGVSQGWCPGRFRLATPAEAQAFLDEKAAKEAAEKQPPKEPGTGYRFLDKEELVVEGDDFWSPTYRRWAASGNWQFGHDGKQVFNMTYRRRNQFAEGELVQIIKPATQALRDREPKWRDAMDHLDGKVFEMPNVVWCDGWRSVPLFRRGSCTHFQPVHLNWLAPASSKQKEAQAYLDKKAKVQELEDKMKAIESELAILKGT